MDRLIWTTWRAFWVALGAAAVLVTQSLIAPPPAPAMLAPADPAVIAPSSLPVAQATPPQVRTLARPNTSKATARLRQVK